MRRKRNEGSSDILLLVALGAGGYYLYKSGALSGLLGSTTTTPGAGTAAPAAGSSGPLPITVDTGGQTYNPTGASNPLAVTAAPATNPLVSPNPNPTPQIVTAAPIPWVDCGQDGSTCTNNGNNMIRYGVPGRYVYSRITGNFLCMPSSFQNADPAQGTVKTCSICNDPNACPENLAVAPLFTPAVPTSGGSRLQQIYNSMIVAGANAGPALSANQWWGIFIQQNGGIFLPVGPSGIFANPDQVMDLDTFWNPVSQYLENFMGLSGLGVNRPRRVPMPVSWRMWAA